MTEIEPAFFVVNVASGSPNHDNYNILKIYDFPVKNRDSPAKREEFTGYLNKYRSDPTEKLFALPMPACGGAWARQVHALA